MQKEFNELSEEERRELATRLIKVSERIRKRKINSKDINELFDLMSESQLKNFFRLTLVLSTSNPKDYSTLTEIILADLLERNLSNKELLQWISLRIRNYKILFG